MQKNASISEETACATEELLSQATNLQDLVHSFKLAHEQQETEIHDHQQIEGNSRLIPHLSKNDEETN